MRRRKTRSRSDVEVEKLALTGNVNCAEIFQTLRRTQARAMLPGVLLTSLVLSEVVHFAFSLLASPLILYYTHLFSPTTAFITVSAKFKPRPSSYTYRFIYIYIYSGISRAWIPVQCTASTRCGIYHCCTVTISGTYVTECLILSFLNPHILLSLSLSLSLSLTHPYLYT